MTGNAFRYECPFKDCPVAMEGPPEAFDALVRHVDAVHHPPATSRWELMCLPQLIRREDVT